MRTAAHLVVIDLAVRGGAWLVLSDYPRENDELPGRPTTEVVMSFAIEKSGQSVPDLATKLGIERTAIDAWRKGARPSDANLGVVSMLLAEGEPGLGREELVESPSPLPRARRDPEGPGGSSLVQRRGR